MRFPDRERVIYKHNPLVEVVAQIRFSRLLEIEQQLPVEFQKTLAPSYPFLETRDSLSVRVAPSNQAPEVGRNALYDFVTSDRQVRLTLASTSIAVTTPAYVKWGKFRPHIETALRALSDTYHPPVFTRIGLRYVNAVERDVLQLGNLPWRDLIHAPLLGLLGSDEIDIADITQHNSAAVVSLARGMVTIRCGLAENSETKTKAYLIDNDFFINEQLSSDINDALRIFDEFNAESGRAFRWCIKDQLHTALGPEPI
jgi:uncharacterized protein (TIGR04255 family)